MDLEKFRSAMTVNSTQAIEAFSDDELIAEIKNRRINVSIMVGPVATESSGAEANPSSPEEQAFRSQVGRFLDAETKLDVTDQLSVMSKFWGKLGYALPELSEDQQAKLAQEAEAHPLRRVVPTPLLSLAERKAVAEKARAFPGQNFSTSYDALWTPDESWVYGKLLRDPETNVKDGNTIYGMRYKAVGGGLVKRSEYVASLKDSGQAVEAEDGTVWAFSVMDVRVKAPRTYTTAMKLYGETSPTATPESLIATQLLHQANGTPNPDWAIDFANEAVYEVDKKGNVKELVSVAGVDWDPDRLRVYLDDWDAGDQADRFGVRAEESGIKA